jgi:hypothetical protein
MTLRLVDDVSTADTDGGLVLLNQSTGRYFQLNATGSLIVKALVDGADPAELVDRLSTARGPSAEQVAADIDRLLEQLRDKGLVAPCE